MLMDTSISDHNHLCHKCGITLQPGRGQLYVIRIEALADPYPPVITEQDLAEDTTKQMQQLVDQMNHMSERELQDQVARTLTIELCNRCYLLWIEDPTK